MNGAALRLSRRDYGCCNTVLAARQGLLGHFEEPVPYTPRPVYVRPTAEAVKSRSLSGSAFIDFPVNKTVIYHDYRRNTAELGRIEATIDSVRNDRDVTITSVWLKGYASPESPWTHNRMLAIGRTEALKNISDNSTASMRGSSKPITNRRTGQDCAAMSNART